MVVDMWLVVVMFLFCGQYMVVIGLMDSLVFGDGGLVQILFSGQLCVCLEDGQICICYDKGDDFVLQLFVNGSLIGVDIWNCYVYYICEGVVGQCVVLVVFVEVLLIQDCFIGGSECGVQVCCDVGCLQGCNVMGYCLVLGDCWVEVVFYYQKMCIVGVCEGCENLVMVYEYIGDEVIFELMQVLCVCDGKGIYVVCDVYVICNWVMLQLLGNLEWMVDWLSCEEDEDIGLDDIVGFVVDDVFVLFNCNCKGGC